jgi:tRNA pseudouridine38-40 synthase
MRRIRLTVAYDGTNYAGWQVQPNALTVQEVLDNCLSDLLQKPVRTIGASRTDAGVHALGNIAVFDTEARMPADKYAFALNTRLPEDIRIQKSEEVSPDFHPRFCETVKTYEYRVLNRTFPDPTRRFNSVHIYGTLDLEAMQQAAAYLEGTHDFKSFATENPQVTDTVRRIYKTRLWKEEDMLRFQITGNGFLYNMVRIITGTLLEVGKGALQPEDIPRILEARDRKMAGPTARAKGLTLLEIRYPQEENQVKTMEKTVDTPGSV